eukprot:scaffold650_cov407-Prasinococcus_capsulatus_cf.AAC.38
MIAAHLQASYASSSSAPSGSLGARGGRVSGRLHRNGIPTTSAPPTPAAKAAHHVLAPSLARPAPFCVGSRSSAPLGVIGSLPAVEVEGCLLESTGWKSGKKGSTPT